MIKKGIVSTVNSTDRKARIYFPDNNYITPELTISNSISNIQPQDIVVVAFYDNSVEGVVIQNLTRASNVDLTVIDGGSFV